MNRKSKTLKGNNMTKITDAINDMIREAFSAGFRAGKEYQEYTGDNVPGDELDILIEDYCGEYMDTHFVS